MPPIDFLFLTQVALQTAVLVVMVIGLLGLIVPVFPGLVIMWLGALLYAIVQSASGLMTGWGWFLFALITLLMAVGSISDNIIIAKKMVDHKIPWGSILLCYLAGIIVSLFATPLAGLLAAPLALLLLEWIRLRSGRRAFESAKVYLIGWGASFAVRFGIGVVMILIWMAWAFA